jgi:hypothetical protein
MTDCTHFGCNGGPLGGSVFIDECKDGFVFLNFVDDTSAVQSLRLMGF